MKLAYELLDFLEDWWLSHISVEDKNIPYALTNMGFIDYYLI